MAAWNLFWAQWKSPEKNTFHRIRVEEVARSHEEPSPKSLNSGENFKHAKFVEILRFVAIYALFGRLCQTVFFGVNKSVSWVRIALLYGIYCILHWFKFANTRRNDEVVANIANMRSMKILWPFLRFPKGCQLLPLCIEYHLSYRPCR